MVKTWALWLKMSASHFYRRQLLRGTAADCRDCREGMAAAVPLVLRTKRGRVPYRHPVGNCRRPPRKPSNRKRQRKEEGAPPFGKQELRIAMTEYEFNQMF